MRWGQLGAGMNWLNDFIELLNGKLPCSVTSLQESLPLTWGDVPRWLRHLLLILTSRFAQVKNKPQMPYLFCLSKGRRPSWQSYTLMMPHAHVPFCHTVWHMFPHHQHALEKNWFFNAKNKEIFKFLRRPVDTSTQLITHLTRFAAARP